MEVRRAAAAKANICDLCDDLMMQILSRLPLKPLAICKCVSKSWRLLISTLTHSPTRPRQITGLFIRSVYLSIRYEQIYYCDRGVGEINVDESLSFLPSHPDTRIVDSRDGFLLCSSPNFRYGYNKYCVCNPLTRQWVALPMPPQRRCKSRNAALVLDESSDFGCVHYKVVLFSSVCSKNPETGIDVFDSSAVENSLPHLHIDVYSSHTGKWAESKAFLKGVICFMEEVPPVLLDGVLFLWACPSRFVMYNVKEEWCKKFDLVTRMPCRRGCFGESEGCPNYASLDGSRMKVWMFQDNTSGWFLKHNMNLTDIGFRDLSAGSGLVKQGSLDLVGFHPNLNAIFIMKKGDFFCCNFDTKALEKIMSSSWHHSTSLGMFFWAFPFSECICTLPDARAENEYVEAIGSAPIVGDPPAHDDLWRPPAPGQIKFNCDAACHPNNNVFQVSVVARDCLGTFCGSKD